MIYVTFSVRRANIIDIFMNSATQQEKISWNYLIGVSTFKVQPELCIYASIDRSSTPAVPSITEMTHRSTVSLHWESSSNCLYWYVHCMKSFSFFAVSVLSVAAPLIKKKTPVATPSSARVNPAPQKTAGPRLGGTEAVSGTPADHCKGCERYTWQCCNL